MTCDRLRVLCVLRQWRRAALASAGLPRMAMSSPGSGDDSPDHALSYWH